METVTPPPEQQVTSEAPASSQHPEPLVDGNPPPVEEQNQNIVESKPRSKKGLAIGIVFLLLLGVIGYFYYQNQSLKSQLGLPTLELSESKQTCEYNGQIYQPGEGFTDANGCNSCSCTDTGEVVCTEMACVNEGEADNNASLHENSYLIGGKYSFVIPQGFQIKESFTSTENSMVKITDNRVIFELFVNQGGRGIQCFELESDNIVKIGNKNVELLKYRGIGNTEICTNPEQTSKYVYWLVLERYTIPPQEGIKDMAWYSFNTDDVSKTEAEAIFDQILSTFEFID